MQAQVFASLEKEKSELFSFHKNSFNQLGILNCPEAMAVTNGGIYSNIFAGIEFLYGDSLVPVEKSHQTGKVKWHNTWHLFQSLRETDQPLKYESTRAVCVDQHGNLSDYIIIRKELIAHLN